MVLQIGNLDAFEAWLKYQPKEVARVMAHRTAARMWPIIALDVVHEEFHGTWRANLTKSTLRSTLASRLVCIEPNAPRATAAARAADASAAAARASAAADDVAGQAYVWESLSADVKRIEDGMRPADLVQAPLWPDAPMPRKLAENWQSLRDAFLRDDPNWQFWIDFYEGILAGGADAPERIALMDKVAQMPEEIWEKPTRDVNAHIAGMYEEFIRREYMRPETIRLDRDRVEFSATDDVEVDPDLLNRCVKMIQDREGERIRRNNELALSSPLVAIIERLERTANETPPSPLDLYDEAKEFIKDASAWVAKHPEDDNDLVSRYISDANKIAGLIYNSDDKVKEMDALMASKYAVMPEADSPEAKALIASVKLAMELSVGPLKIGLEADWARLKSAIAAKLPLHLIRPWQYRLASRLLEIRASALEGREFIMSRITVENLQQATEYMRITKDFSEPWLYWAGIIYVICRYLGQEKAGS